MSEEQQLIAEARLMREFVDVRRRVTVLAGEIHRQGIAAQFFGSFRHAMLTGSDPGWNLDLEIREMKSGAELLALVAEYRTAKMEFDRARQGLAGLGLSPPD